MCPKGELSNTRHRRWLVVSRQISITQLMTLTMLLLPLHSPKFLRVVTTLVPAAGAPPLVSNGDCPQLVPELLVPAVEFALLCLAFCFIPEGLANIGHFFFAAKKLPIALCSPDDGRSSPAAGRISHAATPSLCP